MPKSELPPPTSAASHTQDATSKTRELALFSCMFTLVRDLEVLSWLTCSSQLGGEATGQLCDALQEWALADRGYPRMALPEEGPQCDHVQVLRDIVDRMAQRITAEDGVADKMDLGRLGRHLSAALWATWDLQAVRASQARELPRTATAPGAGAPPYLQSGGAP